MSSFVRHLLVNRSTRQANNGTSLLMERVAHEGESADAQGGGGDGASASLAPLQGEAMRLLQLLPRLSRWARTRVSQVGAASDLSLRQYGALYMIRNGAISPTELSRLWQVTPAVITGIVDRLVRRGLARREPDPSDRRRLCLALTDVGVAACDAVDQALTEDLVRQLASATSADLRALERALTLLERALGAIEAAAGAPPHDERVAGGSTSPPAPDDEHPSAPARRRR